MTAAGIIMRESFAQSGDRILRMLYPPSKIASSGYTQEKRDAIAAKSFHKQHFQDAEAKGKICKGAYDSNDQLLGVAVWVKPGIPVHAKKEESKDDDNEEKNLEMDYSVLGRLIAELTNHRYDVMGDTPHW